MFSATKNKLDQNTTIVPPIANFPGNTGPPVGPVPTRRFSQPVSRAHRSPRAQPQRKIEVEYTDDSVVSQEDIELLAKIKTKKSRGEKITKQEASFMGSIMTALGFGDSSTNESSSQKNTTAYSLNSTKNMYFCTNTFQSSHRIYYLSFKFNCSNVTVEN